MKIESFSFTIPELTEQLNDSAQHLIHRLHKEGVITKEALSQSKQYMIQVTPRSWLQSFLSWIFLPLEEKHGAKIIIVKIVGERTEQEAKAQKSQNPNTVFKQVVDDIIDKS